MSNEATRIFGLARWGALTGLVAAFAVACSSPAPEAAEFHQGDACHQEGERDGDLVCENGIWVQPEGDAGLDVNEQNDCSLESHEEFCERHQLECGSFEGLDNCERERTVHCDEFDGFGCEAPESCAYAADNDELETNVCRCPELGADAEAEICEHAGAECGTIDAGEVCDEWGEEYGEIDCGDCEGEDECGEELDNICGCPCEIDGECYAAGETSPDESCLVCDPDASRHEFTEASDGTECGDNMVCDDAECICEDGITVCSGDCVDLDTSRDHCGECDNACDENEVCDSGTCEEECPDGESLCDGVCVDTDTDPDHCGGCGVECDDNETCENGSCQGECASDETLCDGECVDTDTDPEHCGGCGIECADNETCEDGSCEEGCASDETLCDGECVDTDTDPDHCGECGDECDTDVDGAVAECEDGECEISCANDDEEICDEQGVCADTDNDRDHCGECGNECTENEFCNDGECESFDAGCDDDDDCASGEQCCDGQCLPSTAPC